MKEVKLFTWDVNELVFEEVGVCVWSTIILIINLQCACARVIVVVLSVCHALILEITDN